jgi:hypothetical protein
MSWVAKAVSGPSEEEFAAAVAQAKAHYVEMPGLTLTLAQASRLWALDMALCQDVLSTLVASRFLVRTRAIFFARA